MKQRHYDIVRRENENRLRWLESAEDLDSAKSRIQEGRTNFRCWTKKATRLPPQPTMNRTHPSKVAMTLNSTRRECSWLDVGSACSVEVTSEENGYPIEAALQSEQGVGWRAAAPGPQVIRLIFDVPQKLQHIWLMFEELEHPRTQEFVLWSHSDSGNIREIVRQQWNFSPTGSVREIEDYAVELAEVRVLEIIIVPDNSASEARASLRRLRLA